MKYLLKILTWLYTQIKSEMTIHKAQPAPRKTAAQSYSEDKVLRTGCNGFAMFVLVCVGVGIFVL